MASDTAFYPESFSDSIAPIYKRVRTPLPAGVRGSGFELVFSHEEIALSGPDLSTPSAMKDDWFVMLKDTFQWVALQWNVIQQASTAYGHMEIVAATVGGNVVDYFIRATLTQPPTY